MVGRIIALTGECLGERAIFREPIGMRIKHPQGHKAAFFRLAGEVGFTAAKEHIHADARAPGFLRRLESGVEHHPDFRGPTRRPPVDVDRASGRRSPMRREGLAEFVADRLVVRAEDDEPVVGFSRGRGRTSAAQNQRQGHHQRQQSEDDPCPCFHDFKTTTSSCRAWSVIFSSLGP